MSSSILVTGATGTVGSRLLQSLRASGTDAVAMTSRPGADVPGFRTVHGDYRSPEALAEAFAGFDTVFLLQPLVSELPAFGLNAVAAARQAGVRHLVRLSGAGADPQSPYSIARAHGEIDDAVRRSGLAWTILGPVSFMQNLVTFWGDAIRSGAVYAPHGEGATALIDARDIADCAAPVLTSPGQHAGKTYHLTGAEALTDLEQMEIVSRELGREVRYVDVPEAAAREAMEKTGLPDIMVDWLMSLNAVVKAGHASHVTADVRLLAGHAPRRFVDFVRESLAAWR